MSDSERIAALQKALGEAVAQALVLESALRVCASALSDQAQRQTDWDTIARRARMVARDALQTSASA